MEVFNVIGASIQQGASTPISLRCPACRQRGSFEALANPADAVLQNSVRAGLRRCLNTSCSALVFFVSDASYASLYVTYPPEVIDFDATGLPTRVLDSFQEAIRCHASACYVAAAMMVRKTLEVCARIEEPVGTISDNAYRHYGRRSSCRLSCSKRATISDSWQRCGPHRGAQLRPRWQRRSRGGN